MTTGIGLDEARSIVDRARTEAEAIDVPVSVAVVDRGGHVVALDRMDAANFISPVVAYGKAYTAAAFEAPSGDVAARGRDVPSFVHAITVMTGGKFTPQKGGLPVVRDDHVIGAVGASGGVG